jgi:hypothetical protein
MPLEARISQVWSMQKLFIALFFLGFGLWFFFDGAVKYPRSNVRWLAYMDYEKQGKLPEWPAYAASKGWVKKKPEKFYDRGAIVTQYALGGVSVIAGIILLAYWYTQRDRRLRTDETAVYTPAGTRVPFCSVVGIGKKKWDSKGLATVRFEDNGRQGQFIVDDYKFETEPTRQILQQLEDHLLARSSVVSTPSGIIAPAKPSDS